MNRVRALAVALMFLPVSVLGDEIYVGARVDRLTPDADGRGVEIGYLWSPAPALSTEVGAAHQDIADGRWSYLVTGGAWRLAQGRDVVTWRLEAGGGDSGGRSFNHRVAKLGLLHALMPGRLFGDVGLDRIEIGAVRETLARAGLQFNLGGGYLVQGHRYWRVSGPGDADFWSLRLDRADTKGSWFGGLVHGEASSDTLAAVSATPVTQETDEYFAGVTRPFGRNTLTLSINRIEQEQTRRTSLSVLWRRPLAGREDAAQ